MFAVSQKFAGDLSVHQQGLVAQWITRLTTDQKIPGSNPGKLDILRGETNIVVSINLIVNDFNTYIKAKHAR